MKIMTGRYLLKALKQGISLQYYQLKLIKMIKKS